MSSSQYQELSDEMKELEKRGESRTSDIDTRVGALENRIIDLAEAHELADREEGGETNEDVTRRLAELEAKLERMEEIAQRLESIEGRVSSLSSKHPNRRTARRFSRSTSNSSNAMSESCEPWP